MQQQAAAGSPQGDVGLLPITNLVNNYQEVTETWKEYYTCVRDENALRAAGGDPLVGTTWMANARVMRFAGGSRGLIRLESPENSPPFEEEAVTRHSSMDDLGLPFHVTMNQSTIDAANVLLQAHNYLVTFDVQKWKGAAFYNQEWGVSDFSTTYRVTGGTLHTILQQLQQGGHVPPLGEWHISM